MRKFILIDHSIKGKGGHYLEYATNVLSASEESGFIPCIAVNKSFDVKKENVGYDCYKVFKYDVWGMHDKRFRQFRPFKWVSVRVVKAKNMFISKFTFSKYGYLLELLKTKDYTLFFENKNKTMLMLNLLIIPILFLLFCI